MRTGNLNKMHRIHHGYELIVEATVELVQHLTRTVNDALEHCDLRCCIWNSYSARCALKSVRLQPLNGYNRGIGITRYKATKAIMQIETVCLPSLPCQTGF